MVARSRLVREDCLIAFGPDVYIFRFGVVMRAADGTDAWAGCMVQPAPPVWSLGLLEDIAAASSAIDTKPHEVPARLLHEGETEHLVPLPPRLRPGASGARLRPYARGGGPWDVRGAVLWRWAQTLQDFAYPSLTQPLAATF